MATAEEIDKPHILQVIMPRTDFDPCQPAPSGPFEVYLTSLEDTAADLWAQAQWKRQRWPRAIPVNLLSVSPSWQCDHHW